MSFFSVILGYTVRQKISLVQRLDEKEKLALIAEAGVKKCIMEIYKEKQHNLGYSALKDKWSNNPGVFKDVSLGDGKFNVSYYIGQQEKKPQFRWGLIDEERKINVNKTDLAVLARLFQAILSSDDIDAQTLAKDVIQWPKTRGHGEPGDSKSAEFELLEELLLVPGMSEEAFIKLKDYITIYGDGRVNINTASRPVLLALGLSEALVDRILAFRFGEDQIEATADDNIFDSTSNIISKLSGLLHLSEIDVAQLNQAIENYLTTVSFNFMAKSSAQLNKGTYSAQIVCIFNESGRILYWQEP